jgi:hypothetical protein
VFGNVGEHTKVAGICTKPGQFSQSCRAAGWRYPIARLIVSGRCKKTFEFGSKRLKAGKNLVKIAHRGCTHIAAQYIIVRCNMVRLIDGVKNQMGSGALYGSLDRTVEVIFVVKSTG